MIKNVVPAAEVVVCRKAPITVEVEVIVTMDSSAAACQLVLVILPRVENVAAVLGVSGALSILSASIRALDAIVLQIPHLLVQLRLPM